VTPDETPKQRAIRFLRSAHTLTLDAVEELLEGRSRTARQTVLLAKDDLKLAAAAIELHIAENSK
jgi:hypothetical protein